MTIRPAEPTDAEAISQVLAASAEAAYAEILTDEHLRTRFIDINVDALEDWLNRARSDEDVVYLIAEADGVATGFIQFVCGPHAPDRVDPGVAFLKSLYVRPRDWRAGIGKRLLAEGRARLPASIDSIELAVFTRNKIGRGFYETEGFERAGEGSFEIGDASYDTTIYATSR